MDCNGALDIVRELVDHAARKRCLSHRICITGLSDEIASKAADQLSKVFDRHQDQVALVHHEVEGGAHTFRLITSPKAESSGLDKLITEIRVRSNDVGYGTRKEP